MTSSRPRVLHIITRLDAGGSSTNTMVSVDLLRKHGFDTALAYGPTNDPDGSLESRLARMGAPLFRLPELVRDISPFKDLAALRSIRNLLRQERFDLVHTHTSKAGALGRIAARDCGLPVVHTPHGHVFYGYFGSILTALFVHVERRLAPRCSRIISLTDEETRESLERGIGRPEQYVTIHSGVPLSVFQQIPAEMGREFRLRENVPVDAFLFVSAGRLVPVKGFDVLLKGFATAKFSQGNVFLAIAGEGADGQALQSLADRLGISARVRFVGELGDVRALLSAGNAFALASRNEGMWRVFVEAMAAGLPVIGTAVGGVPTLIHNNISGLLVPPEMPEAMAAAMENVSSDRELRARLGAAACRAVYPAYDEETMIQRLASLYTEVLKETR